MSPELGFLLFASLLWGPTVLWLVFRALRAPRRRLPEPFNAVSEPTPSSQVAPAALESMVGSDEFWVCAACRSLNRREANRCYACRTAKGSADRQAPRELPVSRWVPVMADGIARSSAEAAGTTVALATPRNATPAPEILIRAPEHVPSPAPTEAPPGVPVCPFLRFPNDPSTRSDVPDPGNLCQLDFYSQPISVEFQESRCLTAAYTRCARYPAAKVVAANR